MAANTVATDDPTIPEWPKSSAEPRRPPARPARRVPPWAGGMAFVVAATSVIALQHYLQSGAPVLALTDRSRAVVSSLFGDTVMTPGRHFRTNRLQHPSSRFHRRPNRALAVMADTPMVQVAMVELPVLSPPMIDGEAKPRDVQATVPEEAPGSAPGASPPGSPDDARTARGAGNGTHGGNGAGPSSLRPWNPPRPLNPNRNLLRRQPKR